MTEYIGREAVLKFIADIEECKYEPDKIFLYCQYLKRLPAADVAPVHRGEWVEFDGEGTYQCTYCGEPFILMGGTPRDNEYNYCPKCGARLREGLDGGEHRAE